MIRDPLMDWGDAGFPYDVLAEPSITPQSSASYIHKAHDTLVSGKPWTRERRQAWDKLRKIQERLLVEFFLYPVTEARIVQAIESLCEESKATPPQPDFARLMRVDASALDNIGQDFGVIKTELSRLERMRDFDHQLESDLTNLEFDAHGVTLNE
ncbi:MAG: hypothetical protein L0177_07990 [Chloroflexi bacterium]|nr:hypothetical protein [Chloroflexota bacterium]